MARLFCFFCINGITTVLLFSCTSVDSSSQENAEVVLFGDFVDDEEEGENDELDQQNSQNLDVEVNFENGNVTGTNLGNDEAFDESGEDEIIDNDLDDIILGEQVDEDLFNDEDLLNNDEDLLNNDEDLSNNGSFLEPSNTDSDFDSSKLDNKGENIGYLNQPEEKDTQLFESPDQVSENKQQSQQHSINSNEGLETVGNNEISPLDDQQVLDQSLSPQQGSPQQGSPQKTKPIVEQVVEGEKIVESSVRERSVPRNEPVKDRVLVGADGEKNENSQFPRVQKTPALHKESAFAGAPPVGFLKSLVSGEAPEFYVVQYGDTLSDICAQLLGEPGYWPKLWSLNTYIKNPHFIWPGMRLRFYSGDEEVPPYVDIAQDDSLVPINDNESLGDLIDESLEPESTAFEDKAVSVVSPDDIVSDERQFEVAGSIFNARGIRVVLPGFIVDGEEAQLCQVTGGREGASIVGEGDQFFCEPAEEIKLGTTYTALRKVGTRLDRDGAVLGNEYQFVAHAQMHRLLRDGTVGVGVVKVSRLVLQKGDILVPYRSTERHVNDRLSDDISKQDLDARVIGFGEVGRTLGGKGQLVFLDSGSDQGVDEGQTFPIFHQVYLPTTGRKKLIKLDDVSRIGLVRIVSVTDVSSVGYILNNNKEVKLGDIVGNG